MRRDEKRAATSLSIRRGIDLSSRHRSVETSTDGRFWYYPLLRHDAFAHLARYHGITMACGEIVTIYRKADAEDPKCARCASTIAQGRDGYGT